jgi:hypothetical protein
MNHYSVKHKTVMVDNLANQTLNEPLLCQTLSSNGRQYNSKNMNHSSVIHKTVMGDNITTTTLTTPLSNIKQ